MKVSIKRPVQHLSYSSDHLNVAEVVVDVHERIVVRVSKTDIGIWVDGAKAVQFLPQSTLDPHYYDTEPDKPEKRPTKKRVPPDPNGAKKRMSLTQYRNSGTGFMRISGILLRTFGGDSGDHYRL